MRPFLQEAKGLVIMRNSIERHQEAIDLLGATGELVREPVTADIYPSFIDQDQWIIWAVDSDGAMVEVVFSGPCAEQRATEYGRSKFAGLRQRAPRPPQYR